MLPVRQDEHHGLATWGSGWSGVLRHWTEIADGGPDEVDAQAGAVRPRVPDRPECGASGHPGRLFGKGSVHASPDRADALVWAFTEILVEVISDWGIYETTRRKAEAILKEKEAARLAAMPKPEPAPGSLEYQALHPEWVWKPQED